jgi:hypothetical protein
VKYPKRAPQFVQSFALCVSHRNTAGHLSGR